MNTNELQKIIDHERGYLDRKYSMGYNGGSKEYDAGYFERGNIDTTMATAQSNRNEIVMRGWT